MGLIRKVEVFKLTISGLPIGSDYSAFLAKLLDAIVDPSDLRFEDRGRSHVLHSATQQDDRFHVRFLSYKRGHRPDVIDTTGLNLVQNPIGVDQTPVEWTHVLGGQTNRGYLLLIEKYQASMGPPTIERYLQFLVDEHPAALAVAAPTRGKDPITINLEAVASDVFVRTATSFTRISKATLRTVRPNPGWSDLDSLLADEARESDAAKVDVTMTSRRNQSLAPNQGIVKAIKDKAVSQSLDYAEVVGEQDGKQIKITTKRLALYRELNFELDATGQVNHESAWDQMASYLNTLE